MRRISILGSTGSVGQNTVDLIRRAPAGSYRTVALTGAGNTALLAEQARDLGAEVAVTADPDKLPDLRDRLAGSGIATAAGPEALLEAAARPTDWVMSAIVGAAGLAPGLAAVPHTNTLALANKESLVCAGALLQAACARHGTALIPVDSEHSAIFQALRGENRAEIRRILLTASGGPFRTRSRAQMADVTPAEAKAHPNWDMGARISVDSASMFNKALEMIEAQELFAVTPDRIEVVVHPQSIVHSMVEFADGAVIAQLGPTDMRGPIGFALAYPDRPDLPVERLDFTRLARLDFEPEDPARFPALRLARQVMELGGVAGAVFNAAKEAALDAFLAGRIGFLDMADMVEAALARFGAAAGAERADSITLIDVMRYDREARAFGADWAPARA
ncbi:MAG: 1-deoxy-D-xylulose-5-phosphate reductoisomerase [Pseudomonadota bacterium]